MKEKIDGIINSRFGVGVNKFCNSVWYVIIFGAACALGHMLNIPVTGAALITLLIVPALLFCKNLFVLMPFLTMCSFVLSEETKPETGYYNTPLKLTVLCVLLVLAVAAFAFNLIYYGNWKSIFKRAGLTVSLAVLSAALLLGGIGSEHFTYGGVAMGAAIAAAMFFSYAIIVNCGEYEGRKSIVYFSAVVIVAAAVVALCFLQQFIINDFDLGGVKNYLKLGFVGPNTGAAVITMAIPMTFYLVYICKRGYLFLLLVALELFVIVMSFSRASLVVAVPGTVIVATALCFKKKTGRKGYYIAYALAVAAAIAVAIVFRQWIYDKVINAFFGNVTGSGRTYLWKIGYNAWKETPIFGIGLLFLQVVNGNWFFSFHCTPLTYLYCCGVVGLLAYAYHRYKTVRLVFSAKPTSERVFVALTVLAMLCNALLDIAMTAPMHLLCYGIMLALIECDVNKAKSASAAIEMSEPTQTTTDTALNQAAD